MRENWTVYAVRTRTKKKLLKRKQQLYSPAFLHCSKLGYISTVLLMPDLCDHKSAGKYCTIYPITRLHCWQPAHAKLGKHFYYWWFAGELFQNDLICNYFTCFALIALHTHMHILSINTIIYSSNYKWLIMLLYGLY